MDSHKQSSAKVPNIDSSAETVMNVAAAAAAAADELLQQIQFGLTAFWLMQQQQAQMPSSSSSSSMGANSSSGIFPSYVPFPALPAIPQNNLSARPLLSEQRQEEQITEEGKKQAKGNANASIVVNGNGNGNDDELIVNNFVKNEQMETMMVEKGEKGGESEGNPEISTISGRHKNRKNSPGVNTFRPPMLDKHWEFVSEVSSFAEFEQLRCVHQVSRNRTFAYGIRYSCTQKTQLRCNCPYLLVCIFSDGAGEHTEPGVGKISVFSRNSHTHPVKTIKKRLPRSLARQAKREREEMMLKMKNKQTNTIQQEDKEPEMNSTKLNSSENDSGTSANNVINLLAELQQHFALISKNNQ